MKSSSEFALERKIVAIVKAIDSHQVMCGNCTTGESLLH